MKGRQLYVAIRNGELPDLFVLEECPTCGGNTTTVECRWCDANLAELEELASKREAEEYVKHEIDWKEQEDAYNRSLQE